jgi:putative phage-type endonuclease
MSPTREEWLAQRLLMVTGTDAAAILGFNPYKKPIEVWGEKRGVLPEQPDTPRLRWGRRMEPLILDEYNDTVAPVSRATPYTVLRVPGTDLLGASLDAQRLDDADPVDAKHIGFKTRWNPEDGTGWDDDLGEMPFYYRIQLDLQMMATGTETAHLAVLFGQCDFFTYTTHRDERRNRFIVDNVGEWWERYMVQGTMPEPDASENYTEVLRTMFPRHTEVMKHPDALVLDYAHLLIDARSRRDAAQQKVDECEQFLKRATGDAAGIDGVLTWRNNKDSQVTDYKSALMSMRDLVSPEHFAEILAEHTTTKPGARVFRFKPKGLLTDGE